jgi:hypothetical protein
MDRFKLLLISLLFFSGATASAQQCFVDIFLPLRARALPGAYGSLWQTFLTITNHSDSPVPLGGVGSCQLGLCTTQVLRPGATVTPHPPFRHYVGIACDDVPRLDFNLRVRDLSRGHLTWGTTVPVVYPEDVAYGEVVRITDIPNSEQFRSMLRVFSVPEGTSGQARIRVFEIKPTLEPDHAAPDVLVADFAVDLVTEPLDPSHSPGTAQIPLWTLPQLAGVGLLRVEVSASPEVGLWALATATNNDTQHVTVLAPRKLP